MKFHDCIWWLCWKVWPLNRFASVQEFGTKAWIRGDRRTLKAAADILASIDWHGAYVRINGGLYVIRLETVGKDVGQQSERAAKEPRP